MLIVRWKENGKWSQWHVAKGIGEGYKGTAYCGCTIPDSSEVGTKGLEEIEWSNMVPGVKYCRSCSFKYWGISPRRYK